MIISTRDNTAVHNNATPLTNPLPTARRRPGRMTTPLRLAFWAGTLLKSWLLYMGKGGGGAAG